MTSMITPLNGAEAALLGAQETGTDEPVDFTTDEIAAALRAVRVLQNVEYLIENRGKYIREIGEKLASGEFVGEGSLELMKEFAEDIRTMKEMLDV